MTTSVANLKIEKIGGRIGAEISGVDLTEPVPEALAAQIRAAVVEHKVVFVREQFGLDDDGLLRLGASLGELTESAHPTAPGLSDYGQISSIDSHKWAETKKTRDRSGPNFWHTDATFVHRPPVGAILQPLVLPPYGGDTAWANTASAYASLPQSLRTLADGLWAVHSNRRWYADPRSSQELPPRPGDELPANSELFSGPLFESLHPIVTVHPDSGERALLLGQHLQHILGLDAKASFEIYEALQHHVERLENIVRWRWSDGDLAIFDNRTTQHYAVSDYDEHRRELHRVSFKGAPPRSVDGRFSEPRIGDVTAPTAAPHVTGRSDADVRSEQEEVGRRVSVA